MSDLIDRQTVIDLLKQMRKDGDMVPWEGKNVFARIRKLPTIQPEKAQLSKEGTTSDMISRTETVERLRGVVDVTVPITDYDGGYVDGVEVGISTVSTMPTIQPVATDTNVGDTISRQATIDAVNNAFDRETLLAGLVRSIAVSAIRDMPSVQPESPWIPVNERLPEDTQYVLLTVRRLNNAYNSTPFISVGYIGWNQHHWWCAHDGDCEISNVEVLAWMPLPEPYKPNNK